MKISEFVEGYEKLANDNLKKQYIEKNVKIKNVYMPYNQKVVMAKNIVDSSSFNEDKIFEPSSPARYLLQVRTIIEYYTNLELNEENSNFLAEYDALNRNKLLEVIFSMIDEHEMVEFKTVIDMVFDDTVDKYTGVENFVKDQVERFGNLISMTLNPILNTLNDSIKNIDDKKIDKITKKLESIMKR